MARAESRSRSGSETTRSVPAAKKTQYTRRTRQLLTHTLACTHTQCLTHSLAHCASCVSVQQDTNTHINHERVRAQPPRFFTAPVVAWHISVPLLPRPPSCVRTVLLWHPSSLVTTMTCRCCLSSCQGMCLRRTVPRWFGSSIIMEISTATSAGAVTIKGQ